MTVEPMFDACLMLFVDRASGLMYFDCGIRGAGMTYPKSPKTRTPFHVYHETLVVTRKND